MIFTCPRCGNSYAVPDNHAGLICPLHPPPADRLAPSPASTLPEGASHRSSSGLMDGGSGKPEGPPFQREGGGRTPPSGTQRSPQGPRQPIEAAAKDLPDDYKPDRQAQDRAEAWFATKFFKRGGIGDNDWKPLVAACKTWGMPEKAKWRDWLKDKWDTDRAVAVKVLITAKAIEGPKAVVAANGAPIKADLQAALAWIKLHPDKTLDDLRAGGLPKATQDTIDALLDGGFIYEPFPGKYRVMEG